MQLFDELPTLVALFFCGVFGYMSVEWLKSRAAASAQRRQKLKGLGESKTTCTATKTATSMNHSDLATCEETMTQANQEEPKSSKARRRNKKPARKACKAIHQVATANEPPVACKLDMDGSKETTTAAKLDIKSFAESMPTAGTLVAESTLPLLVSPLESIAVSVHEHCDAPASDGTTTGGARMTADIADAEADDEAEVEAGLATKVQEAIVDDQEEPHLWTADAEPVCEQPVLILEQGATMQRDDMEECQQTMAHDQSELGQHKEEEEGKDQETEVESTSARNKEDEENEETLGEVNPKELVSAQEQLELGQREVQLSEVGQSDEEQYSLRKPDLDKWMETTGEGSVGLRREGATTRSSVLSHDWAEAEDDDEDSTETGVEFMHPSCIRALDCSASEHDSWSEPWTNDQAPTPDSMSGWSGKRSHGSNTWMTPFALADGEMPGWFTDDKWFGNGQRSSQDQQLHDDGDSAGWFSDEKWFNEQQSAPLNDVWMTPFDELIQRTTSHIAASVACFAPSVGSPTESAVCIWKADSHAVSEAVGDQSEEKDATEIFTDGEQVFWSVPSATGQPLFTDGKQIYASVCVGVGPPCEADDPTVPTACSGAKFHHGATNLASPPCATVSFMADLSDDDED